MVINGSCSTNMYARQLSFNFSSMVWRGQVLKYSFTQNYSATDEIARWVVESTEGSAAPPIARNYSHNVQY